MNTEHSESPGNGDVEVQRKLNPGGPLGGITGKGFLPGQSGCPGGKRKGRSPTKMLAQISTPDELRKVCESILTAASKGDIAAAKLIFDRLDGSVASILQMAAGPTPRPNELPDDFFERLVSDAETTCKRAFPQWDRAAEVVTLKWNAASEANNAPPMIIEIVRPCPVCEKETAPGCPETSRNVSSGTLTPPAPPHEPIAVCAPAPAPEPIAPPEPPPAPETPPPVMQFREAYQRPSRFTGCDG